MGSKWHEGEEYKALDYSRLVALLIPAVNTLSQRVKDLESLETIGQVASRINPMAAAPNSVNAACHDLSVYVRNACKSECNVCGCWAFGFQTFETHESDSDSSVPCCD